MPRIMGRLAGLQHITLEELLMRLEKTVESGDGIIIGLEQASRLHYQIVLQTNFNANPKKNMEVYRHRLKKEFPEFFGNASYTLKQCDNDVRALSYAVKDCNWVQSGFPAELIDEAVRLSYRKADVQLTKKETDKKFFEELEKEDLALIENRLQPENWYDRVMEVYKRYDKPPAIISLRTRFHKAMMMKGDKNFIRWHRNKIIGMYDE